MATLEDLWRSLFPSAAPVHDLSPADACRDVGWVRVLKARVPAFDALDPGDLAIIPGGALAILAGGLPGMSVLVDDLLGAGASALLLVEAGTRDSGSRDAASRAAESALEALAAAATGAGLPALRLRSGEPSQLERAIIGYLVNRRAEVDRQAARLEALLEETALRGGDPEALVAATASFLGRGVALEGGRGDVLSVHAPTDATAAAAAVARYMSRSRRALLRVALPSPPVTVTPSSLPGGASVTTGSATGAAPAASGGGSPGSIVLLGEPPVSELERVALQRVAGLIALELARDTAVRHARDAVRQGEPLPSDGPPWAVLVARQGGGDGASDPATSVERREQVRHEIRLMAPPRRLALRGDAHSLELRAVMAADDSDRLGLILAARVAAFIGRCVAVSRPFRDPAGRGLAEAEARATLEAAERLPDAPSVARGDRLPAYRLLGDLHNLPDAADQARAILAPLLAARPTVQRERLATLRALLDQPGIAEAAAALGVHRNTIAYRVRRYEQLTGWRLSDPELRLPLAIAVRLVQTDQER